MTASRIEMRPLVTFVLAIPLLVAVATPAAAPAPSVTEELLTGKVIGEVEPGVCRVINDGIRDPSRRASVVEDEPLGASASGSPSRASSRGQSPGSPPSLPGLEDFPRAEREDLTPHQNLDGIGAG